MVENAQFLSPTLKQSVLIQKFALSMANKIFDWLFWKYVVHFLNQVNQMIFFHIEEIIVVCN